MDSKVIEIAMPGVSFSCHNGASRPLQDSRQVILSLSQRKCYGVY